MKNSSKAAEPMKAVGKKKVSSTKVNQRKGAEAARETIGIDLGDKVSRYAILDAEGAMVEEGVRPKQRQSGDCDPQLHISKAGDKYVRKLLVQCAHHILGRFCKDSALRQWGLKIAQRGGKNALKRAIVAVARKLAVLMHRLWRKAEVFQPFPLAA
jgi:Transposase IS116/IS110/IS902 family